MSRSAALLNLTFMLAALTAPTSGIAESDASLEYALELDQDAVELGRGTYFRFFYRNASSLPIRTYGPVFDFDSRFVNCNQPLPDIVPMQWEPLGPGEARFFEVYVPVDYGFSPESVGEYRIAVHLGHTSDGEVFRLRRGVTLVVRRLPAHGFHPYEEYLIEKTGCAYSRVGPRVSLRSFNYANARYAAWEAAQRETNIRGDQRSLEFSDYNSLYYSKAYQSLLALGTPDSHFNYENTLNLIKKALRNDPGIGLSFENKFRVDVQWQIQLGRTNLPRIYYSVFIAYHEGVDATLAYLRGLSAGHLTPYEAAYASQLIHDLESLAHEYLP